MPVLQSIAPVLTRLTLNSLLGKLSEGDDPIAPEAVVKLFTAGPAPITPEAVAGDFTEATFTGYAAAPAAAFVAGYGAPNESAWMAKVDASFLATGSATPNVVLGYFVTQTTQLILAEYFETPVNIDSAGDFIDLATFFPISFVPEIGT